MIARVLSELLFTVTLFSVAPLDASLLEARVSAVPAPFEAGHLLLSQGHAYLPAADHKDVLPPKKVVSNSFGVMTSADSAIVVDVGSGATLYAKKPDDVRPMGSITKLMTALVFLETNPDLDASVTLLPDDYVPGGRTYLHFDDQVTLRDVLAVAIVGSDNTSAHALARLSGMTEEEFVVRMNEKARELRMGQSVFTDLSGIASTNVSTARDVTSLLFAAHASDVLRPFMVMQSVTVTQGSGFRVTLESTNLLLREEDGAYSVSAGKTGYIPQAGYCFATIIEHDGNRVAIVVLGAKETEDRFSDAKNLAVWAFNTFVWPKE